jgi:helix-turn-helix protein
VTILVGQLIRSTFAAERRRLPTGEALPSSLPPSIRSAPHTPGSPSRLRFQALHRFHSLRPDFERLGRRLPPGTGGCATTPRASGHDGPHRRFSIQGFRRWALARPVSRPSRRPATGHPGSYPDRTSTKTGRFHGARGLPWAGSPARAGLLSQLRLQLSEYRWPTVCSVAVRVRYRYRIYPRPEQQKALARVFGCPRIVTNYCLRLREACHVAREEISDTEVQRRVCSACGV